MFLSLLSLSSYLLFLDFKSCFLLFLSNFLYLVKFRSRFRDSAELDLRSLIEIGFISAQGFWFKARYKSLGLYRISGLFYIRYPAGYPVLFAGYPAGRITGYLKLKFSLKKLILKIFYLLFSRISGQISICYNLTKVITLTVFSNDFEFVCLSSVYGEIVLTD